MGLWHMKKRLQGPRGEISPSLMKGETYRRRALSPYPHCTFHHTHPHSSHLGVWSGEDGDAGAVAAYEGGTQG